jgi:hypothetical protein
MQGQRRNKEEKDNHYPQVRKKVQGQRAQFLFIHFELFGEPWSVGVPQNQGRNPVEQSEENTNHKSAQENVPQQNDLFAVHDSPVVSDGSIDMRLSCQRNLRELMKAMDQLRACELAR